MRLKTLSLAVAAFSAAAGAASADVLADLGPVGTCWTRAYDAAHLQAHPRQTVTRFDLVVAPRHGGEQRGSRMVGYGVRLRQPNELAIGGADCRPAGAAARCEAALEAGAFRLESRPGGLRLTVIDSLQMERPNGEYTPNLAASDDRVIDLVRAPATACDVGTTPGG